MTYNNVFFKEINISMGEGKERGLHQWNVVVCMQGIFQNKTHLSQRVFVGNVVQNNKGHNV